MTTSSSFSSLRQNSQTQQITKKYTSSREKKQGTIRLYNKPKKTNIANVVRMGAVRVKGSKLVENYGRNTGYSQEARPTQRRYHFQNRNSRRDHNYDHSRFKHNEQSRKFQPNPSRGPKGSRKYHEEHEAITIPKT